MIFKMVYTDQLFAMFLQPNPTRITSIDQLVEANIPIFAEYEGYVQSSFYIQIKSWVNLGMPVFPNFSHDFFNFIRNKTYRGIARGNFNLLLNNNKNESFACLCSREMANLYLIAMEGFERLHGGEVYILDEVYGKYERIRSAGFIHIEQRIEE